MSGLGLDVRPDLAGTSADDEVECYFCCCSPNVSLCGRDLTGEPCCPDDCGHPDCDRCGPIRDLPCILCGFSTSDPHCYCGCCT